MFEKVDEALQAYQAGRCDAYTTDASGLYSRAAAACQARRPRRAAGDHLQGAARAVRAPGRLPVVHHREVGALRAAQCGGSSASRKANVDEMAQLDQSRDQAPARQGRRFRQGHRPRQRLGLSGSSSRSATTARSSSATSAPARASRSTAASTSCGPRAGCSTRRRSAERRPSAGRQTAGALA